MYSWKCNCDHFCSICRFICFTRTRSTTRSHNWHVIVWNVRSPNGFFRSQPSHLRFAHLLFSNWTVQTLNAALYVCHEPSVVWRLAALPRSACTIRSSFALAEFAAVERYVWMWQDDAILLFAILVDIVFVLANYCWELFAFHTQTDTQKNILRQSSLTCITTWNKNSQSEWIEFSAKSIIYQFIVWHSIIYVCTSHASVHPSFIFC